MLFGMLQYYFGKKIFGVIGNNPKEKLSEVTEIVEKTEEIIEEEETPSNVVRDRLFVVGVLMVASIFFFLAFEQAGGSLSIFAKDYTQRVLEGAAATSLNGLMPLLQFSRFLLLPLY